MLDFWASFLVGYAVTALAELIFLEIQRVRRERKWRA